MGLQDAGDRNHAISNDFFINTFLKQNFELKL